MSEFYVEAYLAYTLTPPRDTKAFLYDEAPMSLADALWLANELNEGKYVPWNEPVPAIWVVTDKFGDRL